MASTGSEEGVGTCGTKLQNQANDTWQPREVRRGVALTKLQIRHRLSRFKLESSLEASPLEPSN